MLIPPRTAPTWPSSEVPAPKGITGTPAAAQTPTACATSSVDSAKKTASGGAGAWYDSSRPCRSSTDSLVETRVP